MHTPAEYLDGISTIISEDFVLDKLISLSIAILATHELLALHMAKRVEPA